MYKSYLFSTSRRQQLPFPKHQTHDRSRRKEMINKEPLTELTKCTLHLTACVLLPLVRSSTLSHLLWHSKLPHFGGRPCNLAGLLLVAHYGGCSSQKGTNCCLSWCIPVMATHSLVVFQRDRNKATPARQSVKCMGQQLHDWGGRRCWLPVLWIRSTLVLLFWWHDWCSIFAVPRTKRCWQLFRDSGVNSQDCWPSWPWGWWGNNYYWHFNRKRSVLY